MSTYICALLVYLSVSTLANTVRTEQNRTEQKIHQINIKRKITQENLDKTCSTNVECPPNSQCMYRYQGVDVCADDGCFCDDGYYANGDVCTQKKEIGESCTSNDQCTSTTAGSICEGGVCICDATYGDEVTTVDGMKYCHTATFDDDCETRFECLAFYFSNSICDATDGCTCRAGYKQRDHKCVRATHGEACGAAPANIECDATKNLECTQDKVCACLTDFSWNADHHTCIHGGATQVGNGAECDIGYSRYKDNGEYCPASHECKSCPGEITNKCLIDESGASAVTITSTLMVMIGSLYAILV